MPLIGPSSTIGATFPPVRSAATKVVVFQCPCGIGERRRLPRGGRPRVRAIFGEAPLMNTRRSGLRSCWASNQSRRWLRTSGRSCSAACPVFFCA